MPVGFFAFANADTGVRFVINDGTGAAAYLTCINNGGTLGLGIARDIAFTDPLNYPVFVPVNWQTATTVRFRRRAQDDGAEPPQIYGSNQLELAWTVIPILIVLVLVLVTARTIADVQNRPAPPDALHVTVVGHQWWWEVRYPALGLVTANELHVPVSTASRRQLTFLRLESADVAHSFWVPQLAGKTDLIPNRVNRMWIEPTQVGTYLGNCAEYCGTQHARMLLRVIVHEPDDAFEAQLASVTENHLAGIRQVFVMRRPAGIRAA